MKPKRKTKPAPKRDRTADRADLKEALRSGPIRESVGEGEYKTLNTKDILTDERYQRPLNEAKIGRILKHYDENLLNPPKVSYRDGKYYVFDGQHTVAAVKIHNNGCDTEILCRVYRNLTFEQEVALFIQQTGESSAVSVKDKLRARLSAGDHDVAEMNKAVCDAGLRITWDSRATVNGSIAAVSALWKAYKLLGVLTFTAMLKDIRAAWGGEYDGLRAEILTGMSKFYAAYMGDFKQDALVKKLSKTPPALIIREGKLSGIGTSTGTSYARVILRVYNRNLQNKLEDRL